MNQFDSIIDFSSTHIKFNISVYKYMHNLNVTPAIWHLWITLCHEANFEGGQTSKSLDEISLMMNKCKKTIIRHLKDLIAHGFLLKITNYGECHLPNTYIPTIPDELKNIIGRAEVLK